MARRSRRAGLTRSIFWPVSGGEVQFRHPLGRSAVYRGLAPGLDVRDLAQILGDHLGAELPKLLRGGLASVRRHAPGRLDRAAARSPCGPSPAAPVTSTSPLTRALPSVVGVWPVVAIFRKVDTCKNKAYRCFHEALRAS